MSEPRASATSVPQRAARDDGPLALICGGGSIPVAVAEAVTRRGRRVVMFPVRGWAEPAAVEAYPHHWIAVAQVGRFLRLAAAEGCRDVVFIGTAFRPPLHTFRIDWAALRLLPRMIHSFRGGDDHLLSEAARVFEDHGFHIVGAHEVAPDILIPQGAVGSVTPSPRDQGDIGRGLDLLHATGPFDVGQAVVVADNHVLAVEGVEGTDAMLGRVAELRRIGRIATPKGVGVLVKAPKPNQDRRFDLPTIGPRTVEEVAQAGLAGIAVIAGSSIIAEPAAVARAADKAGVFVIGIEDRSPP